MAYTYEKQKEASRSGAARRSRAGRDLGAISDVAVPARRAASRLDFRYFCEQYFPDTYRLGWSQDHLDVIAAIEETALRGGQFAMAMPRGNGKTSLCEHAGLWAGAHGHRAFVVLIGASEDNAIESLDSIKAEIEGNDRLAADFPELCEPVAALEGIANRCAGQLYRGVRTQIEWSAKRIVLPTISPAGWAEREDHREFLRPDGLALGSSAIIRVVGITGTIRGMKFKRPGGEAIRPDFTVIDDPQTDESAASPAQCEKRERTLAKAVLGLGGSKRRIAAIMPCTVILPGDMADNILDRKKHPEWNGKRTRMVYDWPKRDDLWAEYARLRREENGGPARAHELYASSRAAMDEGARVGWPERHYPDEISAIQHAYNILIDRGEPAFRAEYQNDPLPLEPTRPDLLTADQVAAKLNRLARGKLPVATTRLTAMIDVHQSAHYYTVAGWDEGFTGATVEYGTFPDQQVDYFGHLDIRRTLATVFPAAGPEAQVYAGLEALTDDILGREWVREDGAVLKVERCLIDANWGPMADVVYQFCRQSKHAALILPSHGRGIGASSRPISEYSKKPGDRFGLNWYIPASPGKRASRKVIFDANFWKTFIHSRLAVPMGDRGCLSLFGADASRHRMYAEHLTAEVPVAVRKDGTSRLVDEWKLIAGRDNHFLDTLVGAAVAASIEGVSLEETRQPSKPTRKPLSIDELKARYRAG